MANEAGDKKQASIVHDQTVKTVKDNEAIDTIGKEVHEAFDPAFQILCIIGLFQEAVHVKPVRFMETKKAFDKIRQAYEAVHHAMGYSMPPQGRKPSAADSNAENDNKQYAIPLRPAVPLHCHLMFAGAVRLIQSMVNEYDTELDDSQFRVARRDHLKKALALVQESYGFMTAALEGDARPLMIPSPPEVDLPLSSHSSSTASVNELQSSSTVSEVANESQSNNQAIVDVSSLHASSSDQPDWLSHHEHVHEQPHSLDSREVIRDGGVNG